MSTLLLPPPPYPYPKKVSFMAYSHVALCISQFQVLPTQSLGDPGACDQNFCPGQGIWPQDQLICNASLIH